MENLPILNKPKGTLKSTKTHGIIKPINMDSIKKDHEIDAILGEDSIAKTVQRDINKKRGLDLVLVGDLTGSMTEYHSLLKNKFVELCNTLFEVIPNLQIGIIFYLDHDNWHPYVATSKKLTTNVKELHDFIKKTSTVNGGNSFDEAVEDALYEISNLNWSEINKRSVVLFGDARPHEPDECPNRHDYFKTTEQLFKAGTTINTVFCSTDISYKEMAGLHKVNIGDFSNRVSRLAHPNFFSWIANVTGGIAMSVTEINDLVDIISAMAAKDAGKFEEFEENLKLSSRKIPPLVDYVKSQAKQIEQKKEILQLE